MACPAGEIEQGEDKAVCLCLSSAMAYGLMLVIFHTRISVKLLLLNFASFYCQHSFRQCFVFKSSFCSLTPDLPLTSYKISESGNWTKLVMVMSSLIVFSHRKKKTHLLTEILLGKL